MTPISTQVRDVATEISEEAQRIAARVNGADDQTLADVHFELLGIVSQVAEIADRLEELADDLEELSDE